MDTLLTKLCFGQIDPYELPQDPNYAECNTKIEEEREKLSKLLTVDQFRQVDNLIDLQIEQVALEIIHAFKRGLKIGSLLILELLSDEVNLTRLFGNKEKQ